MGYTGWGERARGKRNETQQTQDYSFDRLPWGCATQGMGPYVSFLFIYSAYPPGGSPRRCTWTIVNSTAARLLCVVVALACGRDEDHRSPLVGFTIARWVQPAVAVKFSDRGKVVDTFDIGDLTRVPMGASVHTKGWRDPLRDMRSRFGLWDYGMSVFVASTCYVVLVKCM